MGIIVGSFPGCGKTYLMNTHGKKAKMYDATSVDGDGIIDELNKVVNDYDIVFIGTGEDVREKLNQNGVNYDLFYPSKSRRLEIIENQVRKRVERKTIMELDHSFDDWIDEIEEDESNNCYKHELKNQGEFIGNDAAIMQYINSLKNEESARTMESSPSDTEKTEGNEAGNEETGLNDGISVEGNMSNK